MADNFMGLPAYRREVLLTVSAYRVPADIPADADTLQRLCYPMFRTMPRSVSAPVVKDVYTGGRDCLLVHNPGLVTYDLARGTRSLEGFFGILAGAYESGSTDGVEFVVEQVAAEGRRTVLWRRFLDPARVPEDRGHQALHLNLPAPSAGSRLELRTTDLPGHKSDWDWSYWTGLRIR